MHLVSTRRDFVLAALGGLSLYAQKPEPGSGDYVCPMDPDVRSDKPGVCPRCGMKLSLKVPERVEYPVEITHAPELLKPGDTAKLTFHVLDPATGKDVTQFEIVHEKLMHVFVVSENLEFFAHVHPVAQPTGCFTLDVKLPYPGMYRILADFYPHGSVPQLAIDTLYVSGTPKPQAIQVSTAPVKSANVTASLQTDPEQPRAGLETHLTYSLAPSEGLEPYLGAWGHMLAASQDLIDMMHVHPFLVRDGNIQFNVIFPRPGLYRIWAQFQRRGEVNTVMFTVPVKEL